MEWDDMEIPPLGLGRDASRHLHHCRVEGRTVVLKIDGQHELAVQDETSTRLLEELVERLEWLEAVREGLKEAREGKGISFEMAKSEALKAHGLPT